ncbi:MAG: isochorismatase family cysteine hydrolase [Alphaproteobacteria bacterium]
MIEERLATTPYTPVSWPLVPGRTALVVIDMQNDCIHPDGRYAQCGVDVEHMRRAIAPTRRLVDAARAASVPIIWVRHGFRDRQDAGILGSLRAFLDDAGLRPGTWGYQIADEMDARPDDIYIDKSRLSAFYGTDLERMLQDLETETLLVCGVMTNQCVKATVADASYRDIKPIVVAEATGAALPRLHGPALEMIAVSLGEVRSFDQALEDLERISGQGGIAR